jgi:hypothetical protein
MVKAPCRGEKALADNVHANRYRSKEKDLWMKRNVGMALDRRVSRWSVERR